VFQVHLYILTDKCASIHIEPVQLNVFLCKVKCLFRGINICNMISTSGKGIYGETSGIGKTIQDRCIIYIFHDGFSFVTLIEEKPCFLAVFYVYEKLEVIFLYSDEVRHRTRKDPVNTFKIIHSTYSYIGTFINALRSDCFIKRRDNQILPDFNASCVELDNEIICIFINNQPGQKVAFSIDKPIGICFNAFDVTLS